MDQLRGQVAECKSQWNVATPVQTVYETGTTGQSYAILVTKGVWYCVRLFVENEYPNCPIAPLISTMFKGAQKISSSEHMTWKGVEDQMNLIKRFFDTPDFNVGLGLMQPFFVCQVPKDTDLESYLQRGDFIATPFAGASVHTGIYLGNGQVCHVSGHGGGKGESVARIGTLIGDFAETPEMVFIVCLRLRIRPREEIATKAEEFAANKFREGEYHLFKKNCQHFAFLCATGFEHDIDSTMFLNLLIQQFSVIPMGGRRSVMDTLVGLMLP